MTMSPGLQGRHQDLVDVGAEALAIDRAVEDPRCGQPRDPQRGEKRAGLPAPAGGVVVDARATWCPAVPPKQIGGDAGFVQTHEEATSQVGAAACHATRAAATSGRSCSDGRTVFFNGQAEGPHGAPDRRHTRGRGEGVLQLSQRAIRVRRNQRGQGVQVRLKHAAPSMSLDARRHLARFAPPLFQQPHPRPAHAVLRRHIGRLHPGIAVDSARSRRSIE